MDTVILIIIGIYIGGWLGIASMCVNFLFGRDGLVACIPLHLCLMMSVRNYFVIGYIIGLFIGIFIMVLCAASAEEDAMMNDRCIE